MSIEEQIAFENWKAPFGIHYAPTPSQLSFHVSDSKAKFAYGWAGSGKTHALLVEVAKRIESEKLKDVLIVSRNGHRKSDISELYLSLFGHMTEEKGKDKLVTKFIGGQCRITLSTAYQDHRGMQYDLVALDECSIQVPRFVWLLIAANPQNIPDRDDLVRKFNMTKHSLGIPIIEAMRTLDAGIGNWNVV